MWVCVFPGCFILRRHDPTILCCHCIGFFCLYIYCCHLSIKKISSTAGRAVSSVIFFSSSLLHDHFPVKAKIRRHDPSSTPTSRLFVLQRRYFFTTAKVRIRFQRWTVIFVVLCLCVRARAHVSGHPHLWCLLSVVDSNNSTDYLASASWNNKYKTSLSGQISICFFLHCHKITAWTTITLCANYITRLLQKSPYCVRENKK